LEVLAEIFLEPLVGILVDGPGYLILRYVLRFDKRRINPSGAAIGVAGIAGWSLIFVVGAAVWRFITR